MYLNFWQGFYAEGPLCICFVLHDVRGLYEYKSDTGQSIFEKKIPLIWGFVPIFMRRRRLTGL